ncbi:MarR family winged helix-turn-helix transcriptional regulator [Methylorubrum salsuginis]|uniref:DNA-binding transcriptional regulator, MarR family n=1 Tax=Methylorubrum salsuginis TaxID=414703 RepID=A0A1I4GZI8_9HYPH|nr:helix-turn-helix domain-containing protein [Methylorubrum salsuginis]SFL35424.1 DNA-binding transcriptional regulator, MarR family [Methylorubrum salsuginis]
MTNEDSKGAPLSRSHYAALAAFRYELRRFLAFSEAAATQAGLPPQQHQALLTVAGHPGPEPPTVGHVAERLMIAPHSAAELVARMVEAKLLAKSRGVQDRRRMELALTPEAEARLHQLTAAHLTELRSLEPALARALAQALGDPAAKANATPTQG